MNNKFKQFLIREGFERSQREVKVSRPKTVISEKFTRFLIKEGFPSPERYGTTHDTAHAEFQVPGVR